MATRGAPPKYDYSGLAFKVVDKPEPLHEILAAFKTLTQRQMLLIQLNGTDKSTQEALRNNFYVTRSGEGVRTEVENDVMRVWIARDENDNGKNRFEAKRHHAKNGL